MAVLAIAISKMSNILLAFRTIFIYYCNKNAEKKWQLFLSKRIIESFHCWVSFRNSCLSKYFVIGLFNHKNWIPLTLICTTINALRSLKSFFSYIRVCCVREYEETKQITDFYNPNFATKFQLTCKICYLSNFSQMPINNSPPSWKD